MKPFIHKINLLKQVGFDQTRPAEVQISNITNVFTGSEITHIDVTVMIQQPNYGGNLKLEIIKRYPVEKKAIFSNIDLDDLELKPNLTLLNQEFLLNSYELNFD